MKYVLFLIDGMADYPLAELEGRTPLEAARTPHLDEMAKNAVFGTFLTLPEGFPTSSDVANMSVLGWDLGKYYTGRGAIESYGMGRELDDETVAFRLNLITVKENILEDYSAGHITNKEAEEIIQSLQKTFGNEKIEFRKGVSYRHLLYLKGKEFSPEVLYDKPDSSHGLEWEKILPRPKTKEGELTSKVLTDLIYMSKGLLENHPVNKRRTRSKKNPANLIWPWSGGKRPAMPSFQEMYGRKGAIISAVDVILGLGRLGQMDALRPKGATGYIDTNYENKARAAAAFLKSNDFVYLHIEAADECSHLGNLKNKIKAIEDCDKRLIRTFLSEYKKRFTEPLRIMVLPDHPVPVKLRKHTREEVPFMMTGADVIPDPSIREYNERSCLKGQFTHLKGRELMDLFFREKIGRN